MTLQPADTAVPDARGTYSVLADVPLPPTGRSPPFFFGEGLALVPAAPANPLVGRDEQQSLNVPGQSGALVHITWQDQQAFVFRPADLELLGRFSYATTGSSEGWGITFDGSRLVVSDGSPTLLSWDFSAPSSSPSYAYQEVRRVTVRDAVDAGGLAGASVPQLSVVRPSIVGGARAPVPRLNELEWVHGWVLANVWQENQVAIIDPASGAAVWYLDFSPLRAEQRNSDADVLNGLAYTMTLGPTSPAVDGLATEPWGGRLWVTGKQWETLYEIELSGLRAPLMQEAAAAVSGAGRRRRANDR